MPKSALRLSLLLTVVLGGCASAPVTRLKLPEPSNRAEIVAIRESSFNAGGVSASFGADGETYVGLSNSEYASIFIGPGTYNFFVRARTADPTILNLVVKVGERRCLKTGADSTNLAKVLVPVWLMSSGYRFVLEEVKCPTDVELAKYTRVSVGYQDR